MSADKPADKPTDKPTDNTRSSEGAAKVPTYGILESADELVERGLLFEDECRYCIYMNFPPPYFRNYTGDYGWCVFVVKSEETEYMACIHHIQEGAVSLDDICCKKLRKDKLKHNIVNCEKCKSIRAWLQEYVVNVAPFCTCSGCNNCTKSGKSTRFSLCMGSRLDHLCNSGYLTCPNCCWHCKQIRR